MNTEKHLIGLEISRQTEKEADFQKLLDHVDIVEFIAEAAFFDKRSEFLDQLKYKNIPVLGHSVELSIGTDEPVKEKHLEDIKQVLEPLNSLVYSDHLCLTEADGVSLGQLTTLPFTQEASDLCCRKIEKVMKIMGAYPFLMENITNRFIVPDCPMKETEFINSVTRRSGAGLLLDLTNLFINGKNFKFDPIEWLEEIDLKSIKGIHLAGGEKEDNYYYDSHSMAVPDEVWVLYKYILERAKPQVTIIEWDQNPPPALRLVEEVTKARAIVKEVELESTLSFKGQSLRSSQEQLGGVR